MAGPGVPGCLEAGQWPLLAKLFAEVFSHALAPELAAWKYGPGRGMPVGVLTPTGQLVAHCGLVYRRLLVAGEPAVGAQIADLMVAPGARGRLTRQGSPFYQAVDTALNLLRTQQPNPVVFGFPSHRAMRVGEHLGLFAEIDQVFELVWPSLAAPPRATAIDMARPGADSLLRQWGDRLWQAMAKDLQTGLVGVRDGAYLLDRYAQHPVYRYRLCLLKRAWWRRPVGLYVLREHGDWVELMDWVAPLAHTGEIIADARRFAASLGANRVVAWLGRGYARRFAADAAQCLPMEFRILADARADTAWRQRFMDGWWLTSGDTDYR